jgi:hypothetical protein
MGDESQAVVGGMLESVKILKTQPDEVQLVISVPGEFKAQALALGNFVGSYFDAIAFMSPRRVE